MVFSNLVTGLELFLWTEATAVGKEIFSLWALRYSKFVGGIAGFSSQLLRASDRNAEIVIAAGPFLSWDIWEAGHRERAPVHIEGLTQPNRSSHDTDRWPHFDKVWQKCGLPSDTIQWALSVTLRVFIVW